MNGFALLLTLLQDSWFALLSPATAGILLWLLVLVFAWSGSAKLRQPTMAALAMVDFGVVRHAHPVLGAMLGAAELSLALALLAGLAPLLVYTLAALLLWCFVVLITRSLASGKDFACFCFGTSDDRLSYLTLLRTVALALGATLLLYGGAMASPPVIGLDHNTLLQALIAAALLGSVVLLAIIPRLLTWNRDVERAN